MAKGKFTINQVNWKQFSSMFLRVSQKKLCFKRQGYKSVLDVHDLWALRRRCIEIRYDSARNHCLNTVCYAIHRCRLIRAYGQVRSMLKRYTGFRPKYYTGIQMSSFSGKVFSYFIKTVLTCTPHLLQHSIIVEESMC